MKSRFLALAFACALAFGFSTAAHAQTVGSLLAGTIKSASATASAQGTATIFTTPAIGHFVLTQACANAGPAVTFKGGTFGFIADINSSGFSVGQPLPTCVSFSPGYAMPQNEEIECVGFSPNVGIECSISGVLTTK